MTVKSMLLLGFLLLTCDLGILTRDFELLTATFPLKRVKRFYVFILDGLIMFVIV